MVHEVPSESEEMDLKMSLYYENNFIYHSSRRQSDGESAGLGLENPRVHRGSIRTSGKWLILSMPGFPLSVAPDHGMNVPPPPL